MTTKLTPAQAAKALFEDGKKVREPQWTPTYYLRLDKSGYVVDSEGDSTSISFLTADEPWELYEEPWLSVGDTVQQNKMPMTLYKIVYANENVAFGVDDNKGWRIFEKSYFDDSIKYDSLVITRASEVK